MENIKTPLTEIQTPETTPRTIEYTELVKTLQLSVAREMNVSGALAAHSLEEALIPYDTIDREHITSEIGLRFDAALIRFMGTLAMTLRGRPIIIQASVTDGVNGYLPWQTALEEHTRSNDSRDTLSGVDIRIERTTPEDTILSLGNSACDQLVSTTAA